jgi:hypothetical protein
MAHLQIDADPHRPGHWLLGSTNAAALAAIPDALVQVLGLQDDALAAWSLHPDEQTGAREASYQEELRELGYGPVAEVLELARPWQQNVVWVDRYHLLVSGARPATATRLLGLYVGSAGRIVLAVHHPSVSALIQQGLRQLATAERERWDEDDLVSLTRFLLRAAPDRPQQVELRAPGSTARAVEAALAELVQLVAAW